MNEAAESSLEATASRTLEHVRALAAALLAAGGGVRKGRRGGSVHPYSVRQGRLTEVER
jgi:hypothetical protein